MRKLLFIAFLLAATGVSAQTVVPQLLLWQAPTNAPASCPTGSHSANSYYCDVQLLELPHFTGIAYTFNWNAVDVGTSSPSYSWASLDSPLLPYTGFTVTNCTTSTGISTCNASGGTLTWASSQQVIITGNSGCNGAWTLTGATSSSVSFSSSCTGSGGTVKNACGGSLAQGAKACKIAIVINSTLNDGLARNPSYIFTQSYANTIATAWQPSTNYGYHSIVKVVSTYYHQTALGTNGYCTSGTGSFSTSDNTCSWVSDGSSNAFVQEAAVGTGFLGDANAPNSFTNGGATFSVNTSNCATTNPCPAADVASGMPLAWETPFSIAANTFVSGNDGSSNCSGSPCPGVLQHYAAASWASQILWISAGTPYGGEFHGSLEAYFTGAAFSMTFAQWSGLFISYFGGNIFAGNSAEWSALAPPFSLMIPIGTYDGCSSSGCVNYANLTASTALAYPAYSPGAEGLQISDLTNYAAGNAVQDNYAAIFPAYPKTAFHQLMQLSNDCPTGTTSGGGCNALQVQTGSLTALLPFATQRHANLIMVWPTASHCTFNSNYAGTDPTYAECQAAGYLTAFANVAAGIPSQTGAMVGTGRAVGKGTAQ
jgi:hypothetical protein